MRSFSCRGKIFFNLLFGFGWLSGRCSSWRGSRIREARLNNEFDGGSDLVVNFNIDKFGLEDHLNAVLLQEILCQYQSFDGLVDRARANRLHLGVFLFPDDTSDGSRYSSSARNGFYLDHFHVSLLPTQTINVY